MRAALLDAGLTAAEIGHVNAHGTSTPHNDSAEAAALHACFDGLRPPVTSTKGVTGHLVGGAGALEAVVALLSAREGIVPPTANFAGGPRPTSSTSSTANPGPSPSPPSCPTPSASAAQRLPGAEPRA